jgi:cell wall-associated NlpC family hydrolase
MSVRAAPADRSQRGGVIDVANNERRWLGALTRRRFVAALSLMALGTIARTDGAGASRRNPLAPGKNQHGKDHRSKKDDKSKRKDKAKGTARDVLHDAKKYKNADYVFGGESPKGFDCSGYTWYVYKKATGMDIGRTAKDQWKRGKSVSKSSLEPADLVFFKNTFEHGLSHVGIYLGKGKFIHAENERTDVVTSDLDSDYYSKHYAGARRLL